MAKEFPLNIKINGIDNVSGTFKTLNSRIQHTANKLKSLGQKMTLGLTLPLAALGAAAINQAGKIEQMTIQFTTLAGSAENANKMVKDLTEFSAKTPFQLEGIGKAARQLMAYGTSQEDVIDRLTVLGDIAAGTGSDIAELAEPFGRIQAKTKVSLEELNKFTERGVPIMQALATEMGTTVQGVYKAISKGTVSFQQFENALLSVRLNKFSGQMKMQSESIFGLFSTLKDNVNLLLADFGGEFAEAINLKGLVTGLINLTQTLKNMQPSTKRLIAFGALFLAIVGPILVAVGAIGLAIGPILAGLTVMAPILAGIAAGIVAINLAVGAFFVFNPIGLALVGLTALATVFSRFGPKLADWIRNWGEGWSWLADLIDWVSVKLSGLVGLISKIPFLGGLKDLARSSATRFDSNMITSNSIAPALQGSNRASESSIMVDFQNMPKGVMVSKQQESGSSISMNMGYSMLGF